MTITEHSPTRLAVTPLREARERFLTGRPLPDDVPDEVVAAWRRARFYGVPHDLREPTGSTADAASGSAADAGPEPVLLAAARPVLERLAPALGTARSSFVLTDERLRVLWAAGSGPWNERCADLSEQEVGHNSAALALRSRRRAEVHGPEHFLDLWQDVSAVSVPVLAPESGQVLGTVTVASGLCAGCGPHPGAALAEAAAAAVEAELLARTRAVERVLLDTYLTAARGTTPAVIALDGRNRLISEEAERLLSTEALETLERDAASLLGQDSGAAPQSYGIQLPEGAGCTAEITPVRHLGCVIGVLVVLEPASDRAVRTSATLPLSLAGRSVPWRHAVGRATELAGLREPLLLTGERGTGKTLLARELLGGGALSTVDAAEGAEGELALACATLTAGRPLLLRHAERLAPPDVASLNSLLDAHPSVPLLITYTPGTPPGPCLQRLLDSLAARSVTLPALRERPDDIRVLLPALTPRPALGRPPLTWTLDALRALEQHPWPGNVTELAHLVRALAEQRRVAGPVRRAELPDPVREGPAARHLSPMEHAERAAILEALRRHGGNKARAALALGIGRATLYRKLRGYRN
ncbi:sigma-54-dependent Fis family transcriptional regulator [Streptomyces sp. SAS_270]|uniref:sigma-54-dependent Fis family transcriptional regulator n=1 Tax=Streptomyces sp. SAS_270 TaxID=3412748 RepID=UPI00403C1C56